MVVAALQTLQQMHTTTIRQCVQVRWDAEAVRTC